VEETWKLDLWGWNIETYEAKLREHHELKDGLANADRELVLRLKHEAMRLPTFRDTITSYDVYHCVLMGGQTIDEVIAMAREPMDKHQPALSS
jgi:hypothetical protein